MPKSSKAGQTLPRSRCGRRSMELNNTMEENFNGAIQGVDNQQQVGKELNDAIAWSTRFLIVPQGNTPILFNYVSPILVYMYESLNGISNTFGKQLCEKTANTGQIKYFLENFKLPFTAVYSVLVIWKRSAEIPFLFDIQLICEYYDILHLAAANAHLGMVQWLLGFNIKIDKKDINGSTAVHIAAFAGNKSIIHLLKKFGASVFTLDNMHYTPLEVALCHKKFEIVELLKPEVLCNVRKSDGETLLMKLIRHEKEMEVIHLIRYADFNVLNCTGQNLLHICALSQNANLAGIILNYIPTHMINAQDMNAETPISLAVRGGKYMMVEQLIAAGAEVTPEMFMNSDFTELLQYRNQVCSNLLNN